jgi:LacI family transcriptional regulator
MEKKPTIRDVAAMAGVSIATVSKFINSTQRFTAAVERRIQAAIEQLGYYSNPLARSMITGKTGSVGVAILDISNPHFTSVVKGAHRIALEHGYNLLFVDTEESQAREDELLGALSRRVDGLIVSPEPLDVAAPFTAIAVAAAAPGLPELLYGQLEPRGRLAVPVGGRWGQRLEVIVRSPEGPAIVHSVPCRFVPLVGEQGFRK